MYGIWRLFVDEEVRSFVLEGLDGFDPVSYTHLRAHET